MFERDLFVSYRTLDGKDIAEDVVADLEARGLACWIAPRDIPAGSRSWAAEIVRGIRASRSFLLILSTEANRSDEIEKEVDEAARQRKTLFVIRTEDIEPSEGLGYHLNRVQWRDLFRNREVVLAEIAARALALRGSDIPPAPARPVLAAVPQPAPDILPVATLRAPGGGAKRAIVLAAAAIAACAAVLAWAGFHPGAPMPTSANASNPSLAVPAAAAPGTASPGSAAGIASAAGTSPDDMRDALAKRLLEIFPGMPNAPARASDYLAARGQKVLTLGPGMESWFSSGYPTASDAEQVALEGCQVRVGKPCRVVAVNEALRAAPVGDAPFGAAMPRVVYAGAFDPAMIPVLSDSRRRAPEITDYRKAPGPKAAALHPWGRIYVATAAASQHAAEESVLNDCNADPARNGRGGTCLLYAIGDDVVLPRRLATPTAAK